MKVLVVDDSAVMRRIVVRTLRQAGFEGVDVVESADGADALAKVAAEAPDLVLCDWHMPVLDGPGLLTALRASGDDTPFGFVTSEGSAEMRRRAAEAGAAFLVSKPFTPESFREAMWPALTLGEPPVQPAPVRRLSVLHDVRTTLTTLLGRDVDVAAWATPPPVGGDSGSLVALYVGDHLRTAAVVVVDLALAARLGAALALLPAATAETVVEGGRLTDDLRENLHEVLNVLARALDGCAGPNLRLYSLSGGDAQPLRADLRALALRTAPREDVRVDVPRYGSGVLSVVVT